MLVSSVVADSFAGERERHTLETLLASRLSDRAILVGKTGAAIVYGWGLTMISIILSILTIKIGFARGKILFYPLPIALGIVGLRLLIAGLASSLGVLVSLRAATVRQAQQTFSIAFLLLFVPLFLLPMLPQDIQTTMATWLMNTDMNIIGMIAGFVLLVLDCGLFLATLKRFQRNRLILD
jgi:ABC-2 type transport system permease protein